LPQARSISSWRSVCTWTKRYSGGCSASHV
jgi:hypothetical protein